MGSSRLSGPLYFVSVAGSVGLIVLGILFVFDVVDAASLFGVPLSGGNDGGYLIAAAVRDISVGVLGLVFALLRDRRAMGMTILAGTIIPMGDGMIVLLHSPTPLKFLPLHWGGAIGCLVFGLALLRGSTGDRS